MDEMVYAVGEVVISIIILIGSFATIILTKDSPQFSVIMPFLSGIVFGMVTFWFTGRQHANEAKATKTLMETMQNGNSTVAKA